MNSIVQERRSYLFTIGLMAGALVGAGVTLWLAPRAASELRGRMAASARTLRTRALDRYEQAGDCVAGTIDRLASQAQDVRDEVAGAVGRGAGAVGRGARAVDRIATAVVSQ
jgi:gas vesicle protein